MTFASIWIMAAAYATIAALSPATASAQAVGGAADSYRREIEAFHRHREDQLTSDGGWLSVAGLFWLKPGANRFGADRSNDVVLPPSAPAHAGTFWLEAGAVCVEAAPNVPLTLAGWPVTKQHALLFEAASILQPLPDRLLHPRVLAYRQLGAAGN